MYLFAWNSTYDSTISVLAPSLEPGNVGVLDNLTAYKVDGVRQAIAVAAASILYLPPYSRT